MDIKNVVFATDFSEASNSAKEYALKLSKQLQVPLEVIHVFDEKILQIPAPYYFMHEAGTWIEEYVNKNRKRGQEMLENLGKECECKTHFIEGKPAKEIVKHCSENEVGILIIGTHGYTGLDRLIMGSVAEHVFRQVKCPILTVRPESV